MLLYRPINPFLRRRFAWLLLPALLLIAPALTAHPHVIVEAYPDLVLDDRGRVTALKIRWVFDELYSTFAVQAMDTNGDGDYDAGELAPLAERIISKLPEYDHFLRLQLADKSAAFAPINEYDMRFEEAQLKLDFTLALAEPASLSGQALRFATFDPSFYIGILLGDEAEPMHISGSLPASCRLTSAPGKTIADVGVMPESYFKAGNDTSEFAAQFAEWITIDCRPTGE